MLLFEAHVTVAPTQPFEHWKAFCESHTAKPLLIYLSEGKHPRQTMCAHRIEAVSISDAFVQLDEFAEAILKAQFKRLRVKLECPLHSAGYHPESVGAYAECHAKVWLTRAQAQMLPDIARTFSIAASQNIAGPSRGGKSKWYLTRRDYQRNPKESLDAFLRLEAQLKDEFSSHEFFPGCSVEHEWVLYDSDPHLDDGWIVRPRSVE